MENKQQLTNQIIADNLIYYRKKSGLTQQELANKINYSDKSISKWERAEGVPDVFVLYELAQLYGININDFLIKEKKARFNNVFVNKFLITLLAFGLVWFVFTLIYLLLIVFKVNEVFPLYLVFIYAIPVSAIVLTIFINLYFNKLYNILSVSLISWGVCLSLFLSIPSFEARYLFFIVGIPFEILIVIFCLLKFRKIKEK